MLKYIFISLSIINFVDAEDNINYLNQKNLLNQKIINYQQYINQNNSNSIIPLNLNININDQNQYIPIIKQKLFLSGEYKCTDFNNVYTLNLSTAIFNYQINNNISPTGLLNTETLKKLNQPEKYILNSLYLNKNNLNDINFNGNSIIINIPSYSLDIYQESQLVYSMGVIVGSSKHQSCELTSEINQIVINPSWYVPSSITNHEYINKLTNNPTYFTKRNFVIYENGEQINPDEYSGDYENIKLVQLPSAKNALGQIKFVFNNSCGIYLHDTNQRELFSTDKKQNLSHGCIRLSKPFVLADFLFRVNNLNPNDIETSLNSGKTKTFNLNNHYKIYIIYQNYLINDKNEIVVKKDIYNKNI